MAKSKADEYRDKARAQVARDPLIRQQMLEIAEKWRTMATFEEKFRANRGLLQGYGTLTASVDLAPLGDLGGVQLLAFWSHNEVHSALPTHQPARQTECVFFRGARAGDDVPIQSSVKIVRSPTHASIVAESAPEAKSPQLSAARTARQSPTRAPRMVEEQP